MDNPKESQQNKQDKPKIAIIGTRGPCSSGGIATICQELYPHLAKDFDITIYSRHPYVSKTVRQFKGLTVHPIPTVAQKHLEATVHSFLSTLHAMASPAQILHYHAQGPALFCWLPRLFTPWKKVVFSCHGIDWQREKWGGVSAMMIRLGEWFSAHLSHTILVCAKDLAKHYQANYQKQALVLSNGVDQWHEASADHIQTTYGLIQGSYILCMGRLVPEKAVHEIIVAYQNLSAAERNGVKLVIAGGAVGTDDYAQSLHALANHDADILFTGFVGGTVRNELFSNARCYVTASHLEGLPLTVLQALANGLPVILSNISPHLEFSEDKPQQMQEGINDILSYFPVGDTRALANAIKQFLTLPQSALERKSQHAKSFIQQFYLWEGIAKKYQQMYMQMLPVHSRKAKASVFQTSSSDNQQPPINY